MTGLFVKLYLDEDVSVLIKELLGLRGYDVQTTVDEGRLKSSDVDQLAFAAQQGRAIVSHNHRDFEELAQDYLDSGKNHHGIIIASRHRPQEIARRLLLILDSVTGDEMQNQLRYI